MLAAVDIVIVGDEKTRFHALGASSGYVTVENDILCISQGTDVDILAVMDKFRKVFVFLVFCVSIIIHIGLLLIALVKKQKCCHFLGTQCIYTGNSLYCGVKL